MYNLPNDQRPKLMYLFYKTIPTLAERDENGFMKYDGTGFCFLIFIARAKGRYCIFCERSSAIKFARFYQIN
jgi:hypothetical protein